MSHVLRVMCAHAHTVYRASQGVREREKVVVLLIWWVGVSFVFECSRGSV